MQQQNVNVLLKDTTSVVCEECQNDTFIQVSFLRGVSKFITGTQEDAIIPISVFACSKCNHVNKDFLPKE